MATTRDIPLEQWRKTLKFWCSKLLFYGRLRLSDLIDSPVVDDPKCLAGDPSSDSQPG